jgi:hypothetical protein
MTVSRAGSGHCHAAKRAAKPEHAAAPNRPLSAPNTAAVLTRLYAPGGL